MRALTKQKLGHFLYQLRRTGSITKACENAELSRTTIHRLRRDDPEFANDAFEQLIDDLEEVAIERARDGSYYTVLNKNGEEVELKKPASDRLLQFLLTKKRYRESEVKRIQVEHIHRLSDAELEAIAARGKATVQEPPMLGSRKQKASGVIDGEPCLGASGVIASGVIDDEPCLGASGVIDEPCLGASGVIDEPCEPCLGASGVIDEPCLGASGVIEAEPSSIQEIARKIGAGK
jgi:hypothetical protein